MPPAVLAGTKTRSRAKGTAAVAGGCEPGAGAVPARNRRGSRQIPSQTPARNQAASRVDAQWLELDSVSSEHSARIEREAQAEPAAGRQAETPYDIEMEL